MSNNERGLISYVVITKAISGDPVAIRAVLDFYRDYIAKLCLRPVIDEDGNNKSLSVDMLMYRRLESKLIEKIIDYRLDY